MGFYPVDPARTEYILGSPVFDEITLHMGNGKDFKVAAKNNSARNLYIQSAVLNGKPLLRPWFPHASLAQGGELILEMADLPNKKWGSGPESSAPLDIGLSGSVSKRRYPPLFYVERQTISETNRAGSSALLLLLLTGLVGMPARNKQQRQRRQTTLPKRSDRGGAQESISTIAEN